MDADSFSFFARILLVFMMETSKGQKILLILLCVGALISLLSILNGPSNHDLVRSVYSGGDPVNLKGAVFFSPVTEPMLEMNDIIPDLLQKTGAAGWGTNVPRYIFGLSRGSGEGESALGIVLGDPQGENLSVLAAECETIQWTDHDGHSFGSEEFKLKGFSTQVKIDFIKTSSKADDFFVKLSDVGDKVVILSLEEMTISSQSTFNHVMFEDPSDNSQWVLSANIDAAFPTTVISGVSASSQQSVWKSPSDILKRIKDTDRTKSSGLFTPRGTSFSFGDVQSNAFLIFKPADSLVIRIRQNTHQINKAPIEFPAAEFETKRTEFRNILSSEYQRKGISNLFGNLGRFSGDLKVENSDHIVDMYTNKLRLTAIGPSRSTFPRGFLWDEGFHLLAVDQVNHEIAVEIVTSWLRLQIVSEQQAWIPREIALSERDKESIPPHFLAQNPRIANPPTIVFVIRKWLGNNSLPNLAMKKIGGHLARWLGHLQKTQASLSTLGTCFRWNPRDTNHCLSSGLDDYPRGLVVNRDECHLDLHVWMMLMVDTVAKICEKTTRDPPSYCGSYDWKAEYRSLEASMWSVFRGDDANLLADYLGEQQVSLSSNTLLNVPPWSTDARCGPPSVLCPPEAPCCSPFNWCGDDAAHCDCPQCKRHSALPLNKRQVDGYFVKPVHSPHLGYVSLFPMMTGRLCPSNSRDRSHLSYVTRTLLSEHGGLMSPFGVISLSRNDPLFQTGENYWRGNIWGNINLLVAASLSSYADSLRRIDSGLANEMKVKANDVRSRWTKHMQKAWETAGGPREYLKPLSGEGGGVYPFAGWTAATMALLTSQSNDQDWYKFWDQAIGIPTDC